MSHGIDRLLEDEREAKKVAIEKEKARLFSCASPAVYKVFKLCMMIYKMEEKE